MGQPVQDAVAAHAKLEAKFEAFWRELQKANRIVLSAKKEFADYRAVADGYADMIRGALQVEQGLDEAENAMK